jgi:hypothetical protein
MAANDVAGLTASDAHRWLGGLQLFHAVRFAVMAAVVGVSIVSIVSIVQNGCTPEHPCGPTSPGTWMLALVFASPVLLIGAPGLGCLSALALGVVGAGYDPALGARGWWAAEAALSAGALVFLLLIRVHQHRVAATIERPITLPGARTASALTHDGLWGQFIGAAALAAVGIILMVIYQYQVSVSGEHLRHAVQTTAVVQDIGVESDTIDFHLNGVDQDVTVSAADAPKFPNGYLIGQTLPVMVDSTGSEPWFRFAARPDDQTPWLSFAILAWLLAAAATLRPARVWWAQRRPRDGDLRGILVSTRWPAPEDELGLSAADGSALRLCVLRSPMPARIIAEPDADRFNEPDKDWRPPELAVVSGQLWYGGVVQLHALDGAALAKNAIMGLPQLTLLRSWYAPPAAPTVEDEHFTIDIHDTPAVWREPMVVDGDGPQGVAELTPFKAHGRHRRLLGWTLWLSVVLAVGTLGLVVTGVWPADQEISGIAVVSFFFLLILAPFSPHLVRAHVAVSGEGVTVVNSFSTYQIPWGAIYKVELKPAGGLWREWSSTPDDDFQMVFNTTYGIIRAEVPLGRDSHSGGMAAIVNRIVDYRDRTRVTDGHQTTVVKVTGAAAHSRRHRQWGSRR